MAFYNQSHTPLFPASVFESVFTQIFFMCVDKGMVSGHTQAIDSAHVKANAYEDSLELKIPEQDLASYIAAIRHKTVSPINAIVVEKIMLF